MKSSQNIHYQRMSAGKIKKANNYTHERVQSSVTTQKIDFRPQKSVSHLNSNFDGDNQTSKLHQI